MLSRNPGLRWLIFISIVLIATIPSLLLGWYTIESARGREYQSVEQNHLLVAQNLSLALSRYAEDTRAVLEYFARQSGLEKIKQGAMLLNQQHIRRLRLFDTAGNLASVLCTINPDSPQALSATQLELLSTYSATSETVFLPVLADIRGDPTIMIVTPASGNGGYLVAEMGLDYFRRLQTRIAFGELGHAAIVDQAGNVLAHPNSAWVQTSRNLSGVSAVQRMMQRETGVETFYSPAMKLDMIAGFSHVASTGWGVMVPQPVGELEVQVHKIQLAALGVLAIGMSLAIVVGWFLSKRLNQPAEQLAAWQRAALDAADYSIISTDVDGVIATFNKKAEQLLGYSADDMVSHKSPVVIHDQDEVMAYARQLSREFGEHITPGFEVFIHKARDGIIDEREWTYIHKDGSRIPVYLSTTALRSDDGRIIGLLAVATDLTERKAMLASLEKTETLYQNLFRHAGDAIVLLSNRGVVLDCNPAALQMFGAERDQFIGHNIVQFSPDEQPGGQPSMELGAEMIASVIQNGQQVFEWAHQQADGSQFLVEVNLSRIEIDGKTCFHGIIRDITERKSLEMELSYQAGHDSLTQLANRKTLHASFPQHLEKAGQAGRALVMMLLDLDRFKEINDTLGHHIGDLVLKQVGPRLHTACTVESATIARLGGDEFALQMTSDLPMEALQRMAQSIVEALRKPFVADGFKVTVGASLGIAVYPQHGDDSHGLLRAADVAMYEAKRNSLGVVVYDERIDQHSAQRLQFAGELQQAIDNDELVLHYQPKIDLQTRNIAGFEALVRWLHPTEGLLYPDRFIDLVEMSEFIQPFTRKVIALAAVDKRRMADLGIDQPVAVNLSARNLVDDSFIIWIDTELQKNALPTSSIEVELTESAVMQDPENSIKLLHKAHQRGLRIAIDDFGTGHSSLAYLRRLPVSALKIDRSFVTEMGRDDHNRAIVRSTIALARSLELQVIAEGVEDVSVLQTLAEMKSDQAQGYGICRPLPLDDLLVWIGQQDK